MFFICFILVINAENAAHKAQKFTAMAVRTRYEYLKDLATNFVTTQTIESGGAKFSELNYVDFLRCVVFDGSEHYLQRGLLIQRLSEEMTIF